MCRITHLFLPISLFLFSLTQAHTRTHTSQSVGYARIYFQKRQIGWYIDRHVDCHKYEDIDHSDLFLYDITLSDLGSLFNSTSMIVYLTKVSRLTLGLGGGEQQQQIPPILSSLIQIYTNHFYKFIQIIHEIMIIVLRLTLKTIANPLYIV